MLTDAFDVNVLERAFAESRRDCVRARRNEPLIAPPLFQEIEEQTGESIDKLLLSACLLPVRCASGRYAWNDQQYHALLRYAPEMLVSENSNVRSLGQRWLALRNQMEEGALTSLVRCVREELRLVVEQADRSLSPDEHDLLVGHLAHWLGDPFAEDDLHARGGSTWTLYTVAVSSKRTPCHSDVERVATSLDVWHSPTNNVHHRQSRVFTLWRLRLGDPLCLLVNDERYYLDDLTAALILIGHFYGIQVNIAKSPMSDPLRVDTLRRRGGHEILWVSALTRAWSRYSRKPIPSQALDVIADQLQATGSDRERSLGLWLATWLSSAACSACGGNGRRTTICLYCHGHGSRLGAYTAAIVDALDQIVSFPLVAQ